MKITNEIKNAFTNVVMLPIFNQKFLENWFNDEVQFITLTKEIIQKLIDLDAIWGYLPDELCEEENIPKIFERVGQKALILCYGDFLSEENLFEYITKEQAKNDIIHAIEMIFLDDCFDCAGWIEDGFLDSQYSAVSEVAKRLSVYIANGGTPENFEREITKRFKKFAEK